MPGFINPSLQAKKGNQSIAFYTMPEYEEWKEKTNTRDWTIKYYKASQAGRCLAAGPANDPRRAGWSAGAC